jgi:hypothetical protein
MLRVVPATLRLVVLLVPLGLALGVAPAGQNDDVEVGFHKHVAPLFKKYCLGCHGDVKPKADLSLARFKSARELMKDPESLESLARTMRNAEMPPEGKPKPSLQEVDALVKWLDERIVATHLNGKRDPGRVTLRRLNRSEYNNTIRDLTGVTFKPADDFPADDVGYGFDNIGDVLTLPPPLLEKYLNAAQLIADEAVLPLKADAPTRFQWQGNQLRPRDVGTNLGTDRNQRLLEQTAELAVQFKFPKDGEYILRVRAFRRGKDAEHPKLELKVDNKLAKTLEVKAAEKDRGQQLTHKVHVVAGERSIAVKYVNPLPTDKRSERGVVITAISVEGPFGIVNTAPHPVLAHQPGKALKAGEAARQNISRLAERGFRRPVKEAELNRLLKLYETALQRGESFEQAHRMPLMAILVSPHFLFRVELDTSAGALRELNDFELASRLSYFLWSTMPDEPLFELARAGTLKQPQVLAAQADRMLRDPKANTLVENFAGQWLQLRNLKQATPDSKRFPSFDEPLRDAMEQETELFFAEMLRGNHPIPTFLDADFTFVNERLARHYGIPNVKGKEFRKVSLQGTPRRGLLTQGSILTLTSNPTRTSPVKRGKWVLETILGTPPPPPVPDAGELAEGEELKGTLRQRMEQHRANPNCATCHNRMDPIGFGFENFDAVGAWRTKDGNFPVEPGGVLPNGQSFTTPVELVAILKQRHEDFRRCLTEKMLTFALGRGLGSSDRVYVVDIAKAVRERGDTLRILVQEIVKSEPFRFRRTVTGGS